MTLCAFNSVNSTGFAPTDVEFLACMDSTAIKRDALGAAQPCAAQAGFDMSSITACFNSNLGNSLLVQANQVWLESKLAFVPQVVVNGKPTSTAGPPTYEAMKNAICSTIPSAKGCQ